MESAQAYEKGRQGLAFILQFCDGVTVPGARPWTTTLAARCQLPVFPTPIFDPYPRTPLRREEEPMCRSAIPPVQIYWFASQRLAAFRFHPQVSEACA